MGARIMEWEDKVKNEDMKTNIINEAHEIILEKVFRNKKARKYK